MIFKFRNLITPVLLGVIAVSCDQKEVEEVNPEGFAKTSVVSAATSANLLFNETFEGSSAFSNVHQQFGPSHAFNLATSPVFEGSQSGRFELRDSDPLTSGGTRSEVLFPAQDHRERWYSFSAYFPADTYAKDGNNDIINQWHQGTSPAMSLRTEDDRFHLKVGNTKDNREDVDLGVVTKGVWQTFVFHVIHSAKSDGLVEVWINGNKKLTRSGGNIYDTYLPRWKVGIYKSSWNDSGTTDTKVRAFYFDNVRIGNEKATYDEMVSNTGTSAPAPAPEPAPAPTPEPAPAPAPEPAPAPAPAPAPVLPNVPTTTTNGFTLIDAGREIGIMALTDGATISLSSLNTTRLNFRAEIEQTASVGSVEFELSGTQSHTYADNAAPYAIFGDNGNGNYFHGGWEPKVGNYTLTATPYSEAKGRGTAGKPITINFTIKN